MADSIVWILLHLFIWPAAGDEKNVFFSRSYVWCVKKKLMIVLLKKKKEKDVQYKPRNLQLFFGI